MKITVIAISFIFAFLVLFGGGVYYGWLAQTRIPSDAFYTDLSFTLGSLSYATVVLGVIVLVGHRFFRK